MTDIVERLRATHAEVVQDDGGECEFIAMFREAADEIIRLRIALQKVADLIDSEAAEPLDDAIQIAMGALGKP